MASVNARPEDRPALRMLEISASLLRFRNSFTVDFNGLSLLDSNILSKLSTLGDEDPKRRVNTDDDFGANAKSV